ncbi:E3 ubiquitin-protein ligase RNF220 [Aplysia californica]|uniref:E3 ubiquitin-protein ligase RNF220 n=1 Tax=Aplysia californica TaxID=6500 RepID=A0ABM1W0G0_APLCA|nr:E3 ubiquitin-protein ligase RNF220 [Aplysia californica]
MDKDLPPPPPFSSAGFTMYRPGDPFSSPLYSPLSFVRPGLDRRLALMSPGVRPGAFRPLGPGVDGGEGSYHSAFSPAKKIKSDETSGASSSSETQGAPSSDGIYREECDKSEERESSPGIKEERPSSISSAGYDTISEPLSDSGDAYERGTPDSEGRSLRKQRKRAPHDGLTPCCPVCGLTLRAGELEQHFMLEIEKLDKIARGGRKSRDTTPQGRKSLPSPSGSRKGKDSPTPEVASRSRYDNFLRVRCNRQSRLSARSRNKKSKKPGEDGMKETVCPICSERLAGSADDLNTHVEMCLKQRSGEGEEEAVDVEGEFEEYEWAGQTRVRATTLLPGGFAASGFQTHNSRRDGDEEGELNVDGDDTEEYGKPQFTETDIVPVGSDGGSPHTDIRSPRGNLPPESSFTSRTDTVNADGAGCSKHLSPYDIPQRSACDQGNDDQSISALVGALRAKLQDLEAEKTEKQKCLICMVGATSLFSGIFWVRKNCVRSAT